MRLDFLFLSCFLAIFSLKAADAAASFRSSDSRIKKGFDQGSATTSSFFSSATISEIKAKPRKSSEVDVVVVGGGYSGLVSARELVRAGYSVTVVSRLTQIDRGTHASIRGT